MKKNCILILFVLSLIPFKCLHADEGMWFPQLLQQLNAAEMRLKGLQIPIEEIYNVNKSSMKDAVVQFGAGCTGAVISSQGLLITNHHCGLSYVQDKSTVEHNYLKDGFWAKSLQEEIPCEGLSVTFIVSINDVTAEFNKVLTDELTESKRNDLIKELSNQLEKRAIEGTKYEAKVKQFFSSNEFYLIISEVFKDIRMVGVPPESIGRFGGDTDNWMWPSHSGDFSLYRIYANKDNTSSSYSIDNIPYKPKYVFPISLSGVQQDDFTMVYGFPGRTQEYISSSAIDLLINKTDPNRIMVRDEKLKIIDNAMRSSEEIHIKYAAKQGRMSNAWKKWKGEVRGLNKANALQKKKDFEIDFQAWAEKDASRKMKYGNLIADLANLYSTNKAYLDANDFYAETVFGIEAINYSNGFKSLMDLASVENPDMEKVKEEAKKLNSGTVNYFKNYDAPTDQLMMSKMLSIFDKEVQDSLKPNYFIELRNKYKGDFAELAAVIFKKSIFVSADKLNTILSDFNRSKYKKIKSDPCYMLANELANFNQSTIVKKVTSFVLESGKLNRIFLEGQREMQPEKKFYPDANSTLRVTYGQVRGFTPRDGVNYTYQSTLDGLMEKYIPGDEDFNVPLKLIELNKSKNFGRYGVNGIMPLAFIATNHTTGGNSGSPVLNAKGQLLGVNFDRVWEGTMSDVNYSPEICRNITLDIRFALFIVDKYAEANRLIDEMDILK